MHNADAAAVQALAAWAAPVSSARAADSSARAADSLARRESGVPLLSAALVLSADVALSAAPVGSADVALSAVPGGDGAVRSSALHLLARASVSTADTTATAAARAGAWCPHRVARSGGWSMSATPRSAGVAGVATTDTEPHRSACHPPGVARRVI